LSHPIGFVEHPCGFLEFFPSLVNGPVLAPYTAFDFVFDDLSLMIKQFFFFSSQNVGLLSKFTFPFRDADEPE